MKKWCFFLLSALLVLSLAGCTAQGDRESEPPQPSNGTVEDVQMPDLPGDVPEQSADPSPSASQGTVSFRNPVGVQYSNGEYSSPPAYYDSRHEDVHHD